MPASQGAEDSVFQAVKSGLTRWLGRAREVVMAPWRQFKVAPNAEAIASVQPAWQAEVDRILAALTPALREGWAAAHLPGDFDPSDPYIQANLALTNNLLVRIPDDVHAMVIAAILEGSNKGESTEKIARRVDDILNYTGSENWENRAKVIARTELTRHFAGSMLAHGLLRQKSGDLSLLKQWDTTMDNKERTEHRLANDQTQPLGLPFIVGEEPLLFPGDPRGSPSNVINCVVGDTHVLGTGISAIFRFDWTGALLTVVGEQGLRLTVSPNHPMLTESGWVKACELQKGDHLVSATVDNCPPRPGPYEQDLPSTIGEIFESLVGVAHRERVNGLAVDFYGERPDGDVDVVLTNGQLCVGIDTELAKHFTEFAFACANAPTAPCSTLDEFLSRPMLAANSVVSFSNLIRTLSLTHSLPLDGLGLRLGSELDPGFFESGIDRATTYVEGGGKRVDRVARNVLLDKIVDVEVGQPSTTHLYTLQTDSGIYLANGIVSHNCRCQIRLVRNGG